MNCEKYQNLLSDYVDGQLGHEDYHAVSSHLQSCAPCSVVRDDIESIASFCVSSRGVYDSPRNPQALWLGIKNVIESESVATVATEEKRSNWFARLFDRTWEVSLPQLIGSVAVIVAIVAVTTVVGVRQMKTGSDFASNQRTENDASQSFALTGEMGDRMSHQQQEISYWNQRIEFSRNRWSPEMRDAFDRNVRVIDLTVNDSLAELRRNPHDEVSEEILNAALEDKVKLLKEFAQP